MHNAAFAALGIDAAYLAFDVAPADLEAAIAGMRALGIRQLAVSLPHKIEVMTHLDEVDETAASIGAVNTVTRIEDRLVGSNTDWIGVVEALERQARVALESKRVVILGAGGAARAAAFGLRQREAVVTILNRTESRARDLAKRMGAAASGPLTDLAQTEYDVLINTTSVGLRADESPVPSSALRESAIVMDAIYDPEETRFLREARARGATAIPGKWWLIHQAAEQLSRWTGKNAPLEAMERAFDATT